jgi:hypothetical protein
VSSVVTKNALVRLKTIHQLSTKYNGPSRNKHLQRPLALTKKHANEISLLYRKKDPHYLVETGDLLILCFEILIENKCDVHTVAKLCFDRYENKLKKLIDKR